MPPLYYFWRVLLRLRGPVDVVISYGCAYFAYSFIIYSINLSGLGGLLC